MSPRSRKDLVLCACWLAIWLPAVAGERQAAELYEALRGSPRWEAFLRAFPKGGDLHTHLGGAVPPEKLLEIAAQHGFCVDAKALLVIQNPSGSCPADQTPASSIGSGSMIYQRLLDSMSMRGNRGGPEKAHDHFFQAFRLRVPVPGPVLPDLLEDVVVRAAAQNLGYLELMIFPFDIPKTAEVTAVLRPEGSLDEWLATLRGSDVFARYVAAGAETLAAAEKELSARRPAEAAAVARRYLVNVGRTREPPNVFAQLAATAVLAERDRSVVGVNLVGAEDRPVALRDFRRHLRMIRFLVSRYPALRVSLHAGELTPRLLGAAGEDSPPPEDLTFHIGEAVWDAGAERIGHGSSLRYERDRNDLLRAMRERGILVEICLTSEEVILGLKGDDNPFLAYRRAEVPVSLNTDDEGVLDTDLTREFLRAARDYNLDYRALKELARNSVEFSFLPGRSLFRARDYRRWVPACSSASLPEAGVWPSVRAQLPAACQEYLDDNPKAEAQMRLEQRFAQFESSASLARLR